jgi:predicted ATPase
MFADPGFYVLDEPESALSFTTSLYLVALLHELSSAGAQIVCATHSPILASTPGADLEFVDHWRRYLDNPHNYLRHLLDR